MRLRCHPLFAVRPGVVGSSPTVSTIEIVTEAPWQPLQHARYQRRSQTFASPPIREDNVLQSSATTPPRIHYRRSKYFLSHWRDRGAHTGYHRRRGAVSSAASKVGWFMTIDFKENYRPMNTIAASHGTSSRRQHLAPRTSGEVISAPAWLERKEPRHWQPRLFAFASAEP